MEGKPAGSGSGIPYHLPNLSHWYRYSGYKRKAMPSNLFLIKFILFILYSNKYTTYEPVYQDIWKAVRDPEKTEFEKLMEIFSVETVTQTSIVEDLSQLYHFVNR